MEFENSLDFLAALEAQVGAEVRRINKKKEGTMKIWIKEVYRDKYTYVIGKKIVGWDAVSISRRQIRAARKRLYADLISVQNMEFLGIEKNGDYRYGLVEAE